MSTDVRDLIQDLVDREARAWETGDVDLLLSLFHPDMVWPWPGPERSRDPATWSLTWGRFDPDRWRADWQGLFDAFRLVRNERTTEQVIVSPHEDAAMAIVNTDTLWRDAEGNEEHWHGQACKVFSRTEAGWLMITHLGLF